MPAQRPTAPKARPALVRSNVEDAATGRALDAIGEAVGRLEAAGARSSSVVDLAIGDNRVNHGLGRKPRGAAVTPTVADTAFAWALTAATDRQVVITVVGAAQPGACVEVY